MSLHKNKLIYGFILILAGVFAYFFLVESLDKPSERTVFLPLNLVESKELFKDTNGEEWLLMSPYQDKKDLTFTKAHILFKTLAETKDEWDYIYLDTNKYEWKNYSWHFKMIRFTEFREFAFNFRNQDFDNRYRYRFEENKIFFDKKVDGIWTNNIASTPFKMNLSQPYQVKIDSYGSLFRCWVDGKLMLENVDTDIAKGSISIILWEDNGKTDINATVYDNRVVELIKPQVP
ncbi:MAG: hypothetical protein V4552_03275 [Pseudomonadota bacterium]